MPGFSAGWVIGETFETISGKPYLTPVQASIDIWKNLIKTDKIKVGIRWAGNPKFEHQQFRKFPPEFITNLSKYPELQIYSLQRDHNVVSLPENVIDLQHFLLSWDDTMACISNLDIVITSCTSIAHIAAGMGKETWVVVPILPYHTWALGAPENTTSPYYDCVTLFRQQVANQWNGTFQSLYSALEQKFNLAHIDMPNQDKVVKRINLGSGLDNLDGFLNVDISSFNQPDSVVDLNVTPWPWKDNEFSHVMAKNVLNYLGDTTDDFIRIIKELYRVSDHGAIWEVEIPHWRCDIALDDVKAKRVLTLGSFMMFNQKVMYHRLENNMTNSIMCYEEDIDLEMCDVQFEYLDHWNSKLKNGEITDEELNVALNTHNNVALSVKMLMQVKKPARHSLPEIQEFLRLRLEQAKSNAKPIEQIGSPTTEIAETVDVTPSVTQIGSNQ